MKNEPALDLTQAPFSRYGSYTAFSFAGHKKSGKLAWRSVHGDCHWKSSDLFTLEVLEKGKSVSYQTIATPSKLSLKTKNGLVELCIPQGDMVRVRGSGVSLRMTKVKHAEILVYPAMQGRWELNVASRKFRYMLEPLNGEITMTAPWKLTEYFHHRCPVVTFSFKPDKSGTFEAVIQEYTCEWQAGASRSSFEADVAQVAKEFSDWSDSMPAAAAPLAKTRAQAAYVLWSAVVPPGGHFNRPAMLMSKNHMLAVWSWDICFNALALCKTRPALAWDQLMLFVDKQHAQGAFADLINDTTVYFGFVKPPIYGWTLLKMLQTPGAISTRQLKELYAPLCKLTRWWFKFRDSDGTGLPEYKHGNDSGWDNCTLFEAGVPIKAPDLAAYLVVQLQALAVMAKRLGKTADAKQWLLHSTTLLDKLVKTLWRNGRFVAPRVPDGNCVDSPSLFAYLPIVLGKHLPAHIRKKMIADLAKPGHFLTQWGLATESTKSKGYLPDGYWRGPIWAPATMIIVDGLEACGETRLARTIAQRFCALCKKSGFAENFDARTGKGLRDPAYTWTASVFLLLAEKYR